MRTAAAAANDNARPQDLREQLLQQLSPGALRLARELSYQVDPQVLLAALLLAPQARP